MDLNVERKYPAELLAVYKRKTGTLVDSLALIQSGDVINLGGLSNFPRLFGGNLHTVAHRVNNVLVYRDTTPNVPVTSMPGMRDHINCTGFFIGRDFPEGIQRGQCSYMPTDLAMFAQLAIDTHPATIYAAATTTMDENGDFEVGMCNVWDHEFLNAIKQRGGRIIVEPSIYLPHVTGGMKINLEDVTCIVENNIPPLELEAAPPTEVDIKIAQYVRSLMKDGDCVQFGIGGVPDAVCSQCMDLQDLGIHTELLTSAQGRMIREGVATGVRKTVHKNEHLFTFAYGDAALYETMGKNKGCHIVSGNYCNNPWLIAQNDNVVSVNTLIEMDLTGQICSESIGTRQYSGSGGALNFAYGALMSKGGRGIMAFHSMTPKGISKIKTMLTPGATVTVPRNYVDYIITEYGIAHLRGKTVRERTNSLIAIAHPDVRTQLRREAAELFYI